MANMKMKGIRSASKVRRNPKGRKTRDALMFAFDDDQMMAKTEVSAVPKAQIDLSEIDTGGPFRLGGRPKMRGRLLPKKQKRKTEPRMRGKPREDASHDAYQSERGFLSRRNSPKKGRGRNIEGSMGHSRGKS